MKFSFVFVCQGGHLEMKSMILAASLADQLDCDCRIFAAIPVDGSHDRPSCGSMKVLESVGVSSVEIANPLDADYPIGNKLACCNLDLPGEKIVFLDSDMICLRPFNPEPVFADCELSAKLEDWHHHDMQEWQILYRYFGLSDPVQNFRSTVFNEPMPLYLNSGFIAMDTGIDLGARWIEVANEVDRKLDLPRKRPNLDQLSLAIAVLLGDYDYCLLGEEYNYPAELRPVDPWNLPVFCHYHDPHMILCDQLLCGRVQKLCNKDNLLRDHLLSSRDPIWRLILKS